MTFVASTVSNDQLKPPRSYGRQLQGDLTTDRADADHRSLELTQTIVGNQFLLATESVSLPVQANRIVEAGLYSLALLLVKLRVELAEIIGRLHGRVLPLH